MTQVFRRIWADPVWSKMIAPGLVAAIAAGSAYSWWAGVTAAFASAAKFFEASTPVWNWLLAILGVCFGIFAGVGALIGHVLLRGATDAAPAWLTYREGECIGMKWRWKYHDNALRDLTPFCLHCAFQAPAAQAPVHPLPQIFAFLAPWRFEPK
jgi:hypothetical protein